MGNDKEKQMKIKIKKLLKEAPDPDKTLPQLDPTIKKADPTWKPEGPGYTQKLDPDAPHKQGKVPQKVLDAVAAATAEPPKKSWGEKLKDFLKGRKRKAAPVEEPPVEKLPFQDEPKKGIRLPDLRQPAKLGATQPSLPMGDKEEEIEPDEYLRQALKGKEELGAGFDDLMEIAKRHFKQDK